MKLLNTKLIFLFIILVAAVLRMWKLGSIPPGLSPDEAALGYNAYSILKTGKDEYGEILPIIFKSFGDYKPGLYVYTAIPFIALFGLTEFAIRLPSALLGVTTVMLMFFLARHLVECGLMNINVDSSINDSLTRNSLAPITASLLLAINPWHIHFSRGAWEANLALTLTLAGIYFFYKALKKQKFLYLSVLFFGLTLIAYQGAKLSSALVIAALFFTNVREVKTFKLKTFLVSGVISLLIILPVILSLFQEKTGRLEVFSVFSYPRPHDYLNTFLIQGGEKAADLSYYLFHSETYNFARGVAGRWFNHFSTRFLFFEGDWSNLRHAVPGMGMFMFIDILFLGVGLWILAKQKTKIALFIFIWLLAAPLPAALSRDQVHAVRSLNMLIPLTVIMGLGLAKIIEYIRSLSFLKLYLVPIFILFYFANFIYFLDAYFIHLPKHNALSWNYGYKEAVNFVTPIQEAYEKIVFQQSYNQPYIYFLFYQKYDPTTYQERAVLSTSGPDVGLVERLDNIHFTPLGGVVVLEQESLAVVDDVALPRNLIGSDYEILKEINYPTHGVAFRVIEKK